MLKTILKTKRHVPLSDLCSSLQTAGKKIVATNGCFDLLHVGHIRLLQYAKRQGDFLVVGLNDDLSVRLLKGHGRPIVHAEERAELLLALGSVDAVCIFQGRTADEFLGLCMPDVWVKGGDYTLDTLDAAEIRAVGSARIELFPAVTGRSTTNLINHATQFPSIAAVS